MTPKRCAFTAINIEYSPLSHCTQLSASPSLAYPDCLTGPKKIDGATSSSACLAGWKITAGS